MLKLLETAERLIKEASRRLLPNSLGGRCLGTFQNGFRWLNGTRFINFCIFIVEFHELHASSSNYELAC